MQVSVLPRTCNETEPVRTFERAALLLRCLDESLGAYSAPPLNSNKFCGEISWRKPLSSDLETTYGKEKAFICNFLRARAGMIAVGTEIVWRSRRLLTRE